MIEPTDMAIAEALRLAGFKSPIKMEHRVHAVKADPTYYANPSILAHAHTLDQLWIAVKALEKAKQFIENGIEFGFIRMPDAETPDSAHETLPAICQALAQIKETTDG